MGHAMRINTVFDFNRALDYGPYAWPGGYPLYFIAADGGALSFDAAHENCDEIRNAIIGETSTYWRVVACVVNWDDENLYCDHTSKRIEPAYQEC